MDIHAEKIELVKAILNIDDITLINDLKALIKNDANDWFDDLSEEQQLSVRRAITQADNGKTVSHQTAMSRLGL